MRNSRVGCVLENGEALARSSRAPPTVGPQPLRPINDLYVTGAILALTSAARALIVDNSIFLSQSQLLLEDETAVVADQLSLSNSAIILRQQNVREGLYLLVSHLLYIDALSSITGLALASVGGGAVYAEARIEGTINSATLHSTKGACAACL